MELQKRIMELLRTKDVTAAIHEGDVLFLAKCGSTSVRIIISVNEAALVFRAFIPLFTPKGRRQAMCEALNLANWQLKYVRFEMDSDDGELRCRGELPFFDAVPTDKQITSIVYAVWSNTERYAPALLQVMVAGTDPALAIARAETEASIPEPPTREPKDLTVN